VQHGRFRQPGSQQNGKLEHCVDAPFSSQAHTVKIDTVQAMYSKRYQRQDNVTASESQPAATNLNIACSCGARCCTARSNSRQTRKLKTTRRELCVDSPFLVSRSSTTNLTQYKQLPYTLKPRQRSIAVETQPTATKPINAHRRCRPLFNRQPALCSA
jgi:hypothetical protein